MTISEYRAGLEYLKECDENHILIPLIERKFSIVNCAYLTKAIKGLPPIKKVVHSGMTGDVTFDNLNRKLRDLYTQRNKLSNRFHELVTVIDKAHNSNHIHEVQMQIERVYLTINHYEKHGTMPLEQNPYNLPDDPIQLRRKKNSAVQSRSRLRKDILLLSGDEKNIEKIAKKQIKIDEYDKIINDARKKIAQGL